MPEVVEKKFGDLCSNILFPVTVSNTLCGFSCGTIFDMEAFRALVLLCFDAMVGVLSITRKVLPRARSMWFILCFSWCRGEPAVT